MAIALLLRRLRVSFEDFIVGLFYTTMGIVIVGMTYDWIKEYFLK